MRLISILSSVICLLAVLPSPAQPPALQVLESGRKVSIRGLSVVTDQVIWASGTGGAVAKSVDGGATWDWMTVPGYEKRDFRDIEAFDENTAIIMGIAEPAVILKTRDGGKSWNKVFEDSTRGMFLDAMDFINEQTGIVIGDPINNRTFFARTYDGGEHWEKVNTSSFPELVAGEAFFASSGTNIKLTSLNNAYAILFVSGGTRSNLWTGFFHKDSIPLVQGKESTGANSIAVSQASGKAVVVGGDFTKDTASGKNCVLLSFQQEGVKMSVPYTPPHGYRSGVCYIDEQKLISCGTSGIDVSTDGGMNWQLFSKESYHVVQKSKKGNTVYLAGNNGRIARLITH